MKSRLLSLALPALCGAASAEEMWDLPPLLYTKTAPTGRIAELVASISRGEAALPDGDEQETLRFLLRTLEIPASSQILVYSRPA